MKKRFISLFLAVIFAVFTAVPALGAETDLNRAAGYVLKTTPAPAVASVGGEWAVIGLKASGYAVPDEWFSAYLTALEKTLKEKGGVLSARKYTEYARAALAVSALGRDAREVAGYDLTAYLDDYDSVTRQGINGPIWALIALDCRHYPAQSRQKYVDLILEKQLSGGGWSLSGEAPAEADVTAMALQALSGYRDQERVTKAVEAALGVMSAQQGADGGFSAWGVANAESCAQMVVALGMLELPLDDPRFVKNGKTALDGLLAYALPSGGFCHTLGDGENAMASEQGLYALASVGRRLYDFGGVAVAAVPPVTARGKTFSDIAGDVHREAVEALAARGIVTGKPGGAFDPDGTLTRSEFAAIITRALGLTGGGTAFSDVSAGDWYAEAAAAAGYWGIVRGDASGRFLPQNAVTRQEAAAMLARAAGLCGLDASASGDLACKDAGAVADWAAEAVRFCEKNGILEYFSGEIQPRRAMTRGEAAWGVYALLRLAGLI